MTVFSKHFDCQNVYIFILSTASMTYVLAKSSVCEKYS